jgi:hypothetical protein
VKMRRNHGGLTDLGFREVRGDAASAYCASADAYTDS